MLFSVKWDFADIYEDMLTIEGSSRGLFEAGVGHVSTFLWNSNFVAGALIGPA
jgi:hypothetical protein